jgi:predicted membrane protein
MDNMDFKDAEMKEKAPSDQPSETRPKHFRILAGLLVVGVGGALFLERMGYIFPWWIFTWPMILIALGLFIGLRRGFRNFGWVIPIVIGSLFLIQETNNDLQVAQYIWPVIIITVGLGIMFGRGKNGVFCLGPQDRIKKKMRDKWGEEWRDKWKQTRRDRHYWHDWKKEMYDPGYSASDGEHLDINAVFGSVNRTVLSKNFRGGEVNAFMGGCELNLSQADFTGTAVLEVNSVFGGTRIILPPNWQVHSEMDSVFGSLEDKRPTLLLHPDPEKILVLKGASVFGGTELSLG